MSFAQEGTMTSASIAASASSTNIAPTFLGGGYELLVVPLIVDTANGLTSATLNNHTNLTVGLPFIATAANGLIIIFAWGTWNGSASTPTLNVLYSGGTTGATGGKIQTLVFTGQASPTASVAGPSMNASGSASPAGVTLSGVNTGDLVIALMSNAGAHNWSAGSGYTLQGNTSAWSGNVTGVETTAGLSEPGGSPIVQASFPSGPSNWNMMACCFRAPATVQNPTPLGGSPRFQMHYR